MEPEIYGAHCALLADYLHWDGGVGSVFVYNEVREGMEDCISVQTSTIEHTLKMHPLAQSICFELLTKMAEFFIVMAAIWHPSIVN